MIYEHVHCFKSNTKLGYCWLAVFNLRWELGVNNALMVAEICLFNPLSNVESKLHYGETLSKKDCQLKMKVWKTFFICTRTRIFLNSNIAVPLNIFGGISRWYTSTEKLSPRWSYLPQKLKIENSKATQSNICCFG